MNCLKCGGDNPEKVQFCLRCHAPLRYTCPACHHAQDHGGQCEQCGVDFAKYGAMLVFHAQEKAQLEREKSRQRGSLFKQILLLPITGGLSIVSFIRSLRERD
jgi:double zinc ribbon protein